MLARYEGTYAAATLVIMGDRTGFEWKNVAGVQLHRHARLRETKAGEGAAERPLHRRRIHPPHLPRSDRPAAGTRTGARLPRRPAPSRVKREELIDKLIGSPDFVEHWTNKWADLLQVNRKFLGEPGAAAFRNYIREAVDDEHALRPVRLRHPDRERLEPRQPGRQLFQGSARPRRGDGEHDAAVPGGALQLQQVPRSSVRALDAEPVLPDGRRSSPRSARAEDPRFKGQQIGGTAVEGSGAPLVEIIGDGKTGDEKNIRTGAVASPTFPYTAQRSRSGHGHAARATGEVGHLEGEPVFRQELRQSPVGVPARRRHHRTDRRHPRRQPADQPETARQADRRFRQAATSTCGT